MQKKTPLETEAISTKIVQPNDTNPLGNLFGGKLLAWMDEIGYISANRHSRKIAVTASINNVSFNKPIALGETVILKAMVSRSFRTAMEIIIDVFVENNRNGNIELRNQAIYTFVALENDGKPSEVPEIIPQTEEDIKRFDAALRRRQLSLILAGKMKPSEATELKALFQ